MVSISMNRMKQVSSLVRAVLVTLVFLLLIDLEVSPAQLFVIRFPAEAAALCCAFNQFRSS